MDENDVIFDTESDYEDFKKMLKSTTESLSKVNKHDKEVCEKVAKKVV